MRVKLYEGGFIPTLANQSDAGFDVYSPIDILIIRGNRKQIKLNIAIEVEQDEVAIMSERSSQAINSGLTSIGNIVDSGYRGIISIILTNTGDKDIDIKRGDKIGQIVVVKLGERKVEVVEELSTTERGEKAHGSSGR
jgi:dUTP pyrophosphatase